MRIWIFLYGDSVPAPQLCDSLPKRIQKHHPSICTSAKIFDWHRREVFKIENNLWQLQYWIIFFNKPYAQLKGSALIFLKYVWLISSCRCDMVFADCHTVLDVIRPGFQKKYITVLDIRTRIVFRKIFWAVSLSRQPRLIDFSVEMFVETVWI